MAEQPYGIGVNLANTGLVRFVNGNPGADPQRRDMGHALPQVADRSGPGSGSSGTEVPDWMSTAEPQDVDVGTQPASLGDLEVDSSRPCVPWRPRRCSAQPDYDGEVSVRSEPIEIEEVTVSRSRPPTAGSAAAWWRFRGFRRSTRWPR